MGVLRNTEVIHHYRISWRLERYPSCTTSASCHPSPTEFPFSATRPPAEAQNLLGSKGPRFDINGGKSPHSQHPRDTQRCRPCCRTCGTWPNPVVVVVFLDPITQTSSSRIQAHHPSGPAFSLFFMCRCLMHAQYAEKKPFPLYGLVTISLHPIGRKSTASSSTYPFLDGAPPRVRADPV